MEVLPLDRLASPRCCEERIRPLTLSGSLLSISLFSAATRANPSSAPPRHCRRLASAPSRPGRIEDHRKLRLVLEITLAEGIKEGCSESSPSTASSPQQTELLRGPGRRFRRRRCLSYLSDRSSRFVVSRRRCPSTFPSL